MADVRSGSAILDEAALTDWGERIGREASTPLVLALDGDLGAGKSTLARAVARGAGVQGSVPSPTYNLLFAYELAGNRRVMHLDLYRLDNQDQVWDLGWAELGGNGEIVLIEWAENAAALLPAPRWDISLQEADGGARRRVEVVPVGEAAPLPPFADALL